MLIQLRWRDESVWKTVGQVPTHETPEEALENCRAILREERERYPQNPDAEFRVIEKANACSVA